MIQKKVCMLGGFAVGKTSLVARFVRGIFSEKYMSTIGVKIDRRDVETSAGDARLMLWDISGEDSYQQVRLSYLKGAAGYLLVLDPTRTATLTSALELQQRVEDEVGDIPFIVVLNKSDLASEWEFDEQHRDLQALDAEIIRTSAKNDEGVADVFTRLTERLLS